MSMTEDQFNAWIETEDGESAFYEYLFEEYPEMNKHQLIDAVECGDYVEEFMDHLGVETK